MPPAKRAKRPARAAKAGAGRSGKRVAKPPARASATPKPKARKSATPKRKPAAKKAAAKAKPAGGVLTRTRKAKPAAEPAKAPAPPEAKPAPPRVPVERTRIVFPKDTYEAKKAEIKAPLKEHGLKWQFLGEGKGRYHKEGVNLFAQFLDDGTHYSVWGSDAATIEALKSAWRGLLGEEAWAMATTRGEEAVAKEQEAQESEALREWRFGEPQKQPGEPDFWFKRRHAEWLARKPS